MVSRTRRALLGGSAALLATLAGCEGQFRKTPTEPGGDVEPGSVADPEHVILRGDGSELPIWLRPENDDGGRRTPRVVSSADRAERLEFASAVDADTARTFLADTDFGAESVVIETTPVGECYRIELCSVAWTADRVETDFSRLLRDADVPCRADVRVTAAALARVPVDLDPDAITGSRSHVDTGGCGPVTGRYPTSGDDRDGTTVDGGGNTTTTDGRDGERR